MLTVYGRFLLKVADRTGAEDDEGGVKRAGRLPLYGQANMGA